METETRAGAMLLRGVCHVRGSKTHYTPSFTDEELIEAKRIAQAHHASHTKVIRARLALLLAANPSLQYVVTPL